MSEEATLYPPEQAPPRCPCPRVVRQPYSLPALYVGPWNNKHEFGRMQADGTIVVWHAASCAYGAELGDWADEIAS